MSKIKVSEAGTSSNIPTLEAGLYVATCFKMVHIGTNTENILGKDKVLNKVRLFWELPDELMTFKEENGEQPRVISKEFTLSLHEKATLRKFLETWRGRSFTAEELKDFDLTALIGAPGMLSITHKTSKANGNVYAEIAGISKLMKGTKKPERINPPFIFGYDPFEPKKLEELPDFIVEKIKTSIEYKAALAGPVVTHEADDLDDLDDDDAPF